ncbi:TPA: hypothetical protein EYP37_01265, partial [Candidatus Poribacteria bacterium]|nr:hypothetical protein [Candidatus Poribacteria bacterium]
MKGQLLRMGVRWGIVVLVLFVGSGSSSGLDRYVIGGGDGIPWEEIASSEKEEVNLIDYTRDVGSIQPLYTDSTTNLLLNLYDPDTKKIREGAFMSTGVGTWLGWSPRDVEMLFDGEWKDVKDVLVWMSDLKQGTTKSFFLDMGVQYNVASIRFYTRVLEEGDPERFPEGYTFSDNFMTEYRVYINDGREETKDWLKRPIFTMIEENTENREPYVRVDLDPPRMVRYIWLRPGRWLVNWELAEWEVYGDGYVPSALYTSKIIDLRAPASWGNIQWEGVGVTDPEAKLIIQTRTGSDPDPV